MATNNTQFLLSVRLMTYNHEAFIEEALRSIDMQQTNFPFEVVIGDDFSIDKTLKIIKEFKFTNPNITVNLLDRKTGDQYHKERLKKGRLYNFIDILNNCKGKYIALLDGDDYWTDPLKLQKQVDFLDGNEEFSGCFHSTIIKDEVNRNVDKLWRNYIKNVFTIEDTFSKLSLFHTSSFIFKRELLNIPKWFNKIVSGDMALFALIGSKGSLYFIDEPMSVYRKNDGGVTNSLSQINYHKSRIKLFENLNKEFDFKYETRINEVISYHKKELKNINKKGFSHLIKRVLNKLK